MIATQDKSDEVLELYRIICRFNYFQDLNPSLHHKANPQLDQLVRSKSDKFQSVPLNFASSNAYVKFWKHLFIQQLKGYVASSRFTESTQPERCNLQSYFQLGSFKIMEFKKERQSTITYNSNSIILLSPQKLLSQDQEYPHLIGVVYRVDGSIYVRVILGEGLNVEGSEHWKMFTTTKLWYVQSLCPISSIQRQFKALNRFDSLQPALRDLLLKPKDHKQDSSKSFSIPSLLEKKLRTLYNQSQLQAIEASLKQEGITLVQGPPGTGKTKTVLGTLSVLLQSSITRECDEQIPLLLRWKTSQQNLKNNIHQLNPWITQGYSDWRDEPILPHWDQPLNLTKFYPTSKRTITLMSRKQQSTAPAKVLVCGPSNASVDEVIRKLISEKLLDGNGKPYLPAFVRVGENYHQSLQEYSLDFLANKQLKNEKGDLFSVKKKILRQSRLVFTTLSSSASSVLQNAEIQFDTVVIDEAGQAVEISSLIPLFYGCKRLILIGDPKQLPATVFSPICLQNHYDQSLFERLMCSEYPVSMLKVQYRMHQDISRVIGNTFYQGLLQNGNNMHSQPKSMPRAFLMIHIDNSSEIFGEQSYYNPTEGECVKIIVNWLSKQYNDIGILSPYSAQVKWLLQQKFNKNCEIKTIDSFQGREKQVIVFSSVRAQKSGKDRLENKRKTIGFVGDGRRLNVALSRAREACVVVGDLTRLQLSKVWKSIIFDAKKQGNVFKVACVQQLRQLSGLDNLRPF